MPETAKHRGLSAARSTDALAGGSFPLPREAGAAAAADRSRAHNAESSGRAGGKGGGEKGHAAQGFALATVPLVLVLGNSMLIPVLPQMERALGISQFQSSLAITLFSVTAALFIPALGFLSDRFSRKAVIIPSLIVYGAAGVLAGFGAIWKSWWVVLAARAIQGLGAAGTAPIGMALAGDLYNGAAESRALGLMEASNGTGKVLSPILGSLLALIVWYAVFFAFPAFCLLALAAIALLIREPPRRAKPPDARTYLRKVGDILRREGRWMVTAFFAGAVALSTLFGVLFYLSEILERKPYGVEGALKGLVLSIPLMGMVITSYVTGALIKKNGRLIRRLMNVGLAASTASFALVLVFHPNIYVLIGLITCGSIGTGLLLPCLNTMITGAVPRTERGMITSLYSSLRFAGVACGPPLFGWLMGLDRANDHAVFIAAASLSLAALLLVFFLIRPERNLSRQGG